MEGGGDSWHLKAQLRQGMDGFLSSLKILAQSKRWKWKLTPCGSRREAYDAFMNARRRPKNGEVIVLLVDSEGPVATASRIRHLQAQPGDRWNLRGVTENTVHLMIQCMETWIVADPDALAAYYGRHFEANALPRRRDLEEVTVLAMVRALAKATRPTSKGVYQKIRDASALLQRIDSLRVRARCLSCDRMFLELRALINAA